MEATKKLFYEDAYATEFDAEVLSCEEIEKDGEKAYQVVLDQTLFFPEEGGQTPDQGSLHGIEVLDVQIKNEVITHLLEAPVEVGKNVHGIIDWTHRFNNMQQHSGEHIFSGLVHSHFGFDNVGFHLSNQIVTMDFSGVLNPDQVKMIETEVNHAIIKNLPIEVSFPSKEELAFLSYRSKIEIEGQVRIVTIPGYDVCACCAPHVKQTGEIGMLKVMSLQNYKGGVRVSMLCGFRALEAFRQKAEIVTELSNAFSTNQEALVENINKLKANNQTLSQKLAACNKELMSYKLRELDPDLVDLVFFEEGIDSNTMRAAVNELVERYPGYCGIFSGNEKEGYNYIVGSKEKDCKEFAALMKEQLNARGGGSNQMIQGSVLARKEDIITLF